MDVVMKKILISFAHGTHYNSQRRLVESAKALGAFDEYCEFSMTDVDPEFAAEHQDILSTPRGAGYWLWKPYLILKTLKDESVAEGDIVFYCDSGSVFVAHPQPLFDMCTGTGSSSILLFGMKHLNEHFVKRDAFEYMECDDPMYYHANQTNAGFQLYAKGAKSIDFLQKYLDYCTDKRVVSDDPNTCGKDNFEGFVDHRHDQSVLSLLRVKHKVDLHRDPTQWGFEVEEMYPEDTYPQIIYHSRTRD